MDWHRRVRSAGLLGLTMLCALPALAELQAWNPEKVLAAAHQLQSSVKDVRQKVRQDPAGQLPSKARVRTELLSTLQALEKSATQLVRRLEAGDGRDATLQVARKIRSLVNDCDVLWGKLAKTETSERATEPLLGALAVLRPYYFEAPAETGPA